MNEGSGKKEYKITFPADMGNVTNIVEESGNINVNITKVRIGQFTGDKTYLLYENIPTGLFDLRSTANNVSFSINS